LLYNLKGEQEDSFEEDSPPRIQVDPVNYTLITNDDMELTGLTRYEEEHTQNKVDNKFLQSLISADRRTKGYSESNLSGCPSL
jgi:hypothetical protein